LPRRFSVIRRNCHLDFWGIRGQDQLARKTRVVGDSFQILEQFRLLFGWCRKHVLVLLGQKNVAGRARAAPAALRDDAWEIVSDGTIHDGSARFDINGYTGTVRQTVANIWHGSFSFIPRGRSARGDFSCAVVFPESMIG
jgi:hypothetical protein